MKKFCMKGEQHRCLEGFLNYYLQWKKCDLENNVVSCKNIVLFWGWVLVMLSMTFLGPTARFTWHLLTDTICITYADSLVGKSSVFVTSVVELEMFVVE